MKRKRKIKIFKKLSREATLHLNLNTRINDSNKSKQQIEEEIKQQEIEDYLNMICSNCCE
jgi:hypothetical protein